MPYPSEHAARKRAPNAFEKGSFRRQKREHKGKPYFVILGRLKGQTTMTEQAYRYPKGSWAAGAARKHARVHGITGFEAAVQASRKPPATEPTEPSGTYILLGSADSAGRLLEAAEVDGVPTRRFIKDVLSIGEYEWERDGQQLRLDVDHARLNRFADTHNRLRANGVSPEVFRVTKDHKQGVDAVVGYLNGDAFVLGDSLYMVHEMRGEDGIDLAQRVPQVSVEIDPDFIDGKGNHYGEAITASSVVAAPVVPGQQPFRKIAASREPGKAPVPVLSLSVGVKPMELSDESLGRLRAVLEIDEDQDLTADNFADLAERQVGAIRDANKDVESQAAELKASLEEARNKIKDLEKQGQEPMVDVDALEMLGEAAEAKLSRLVDEGRIVPAVAEKLKAALIGKPNERPAKLLSRKLSGADKPLAVTLLEALADNPVCLSNKPRTGAQVLSKPYEDEDKDKAKRMSRHREDMTAMAYPVLAKT